MSFNYNIFISFVYSIDFSEEHLHPAEFLIQIYYFGKQDAYDKYRAPVQNGFSF